MVSPGDAERIVLAIAKQPVCVACLVKTTGVARPRVESALRMIEPILQVRMPAICHACLDAGKVFRLA